MMPYVLTLLAFPVAYYLTHSEISYRQPIDPELVVLASFGVFGRQKPILRSPSCKKSQANG
jgi:hypothetical protein